MSVRLLPLLALAAVGCAKGTAPETASTKWWLLEDVDDDDDGDFDDDDDDDEELPPGTTLWGEVFLGDSGGIDEGAIGVVIVSEEGELVCEVEYTIAGGDSDDSCGGCSFAYQLELGEELFAEDEEGLCAAGGYLGMTGQRVGIGHGGGTLYQEVDGDWLGAGWSELEVDEWFFAATREDE